MLHLLKLLQRALTKHLQRAINESLFADPPYPGVKLPGDGLTALKATASETCTLFMLILVPLLAAAQHEGVLPILESMTGQQLGSFVFQVRVHALPLSCLQIDVFPMTIDNLQLEVASMGCYGRVINRWRHCSLMRLRVSCFDSSGSAINWQLLALPHLMQSGTLAPSRWCWQGTALLWCREMLHACQWIDPIALWFATYLEWDALRDSTLHTEDTLLALQDLHGGRSMLRSAIGRSNNWC